MMQINASCDMSFLLGNFQLSDMQVALYRKVGSAELLSQVREKRQRWLEVCIHAQKHGLHGLTLSTKEGSQWCFITPDPEPGFHRYTCFDRKGFYAHGTYQTAEAALVEVFKMGFRTIVSPEVLEQISTSPEWELLV